MAKRKKGTKPIWSVTRIKHPSYPEMTVRVGEFQAGGMLHLFRKVNGKQQSKSLHCRRRDLDSNQEQHARRLAASYIEGLVNPASVVDPPGISHMPGHKSKSVGPLTISALADKYEIDGLVRVTSGYKSDTLAC